MKVQCLVPDAAEVELGPLLTRLRAEPPLTPFEPLLLEFADALSHALTRGQELRAYPEIIALGHWARKASVVGYQRELLALEREHALLVPRGLVFHVPPANVDTIFMYSWLLSLLVGNVNLIRLSARESPQVELVCARLATLLEEPRFARIRRTITIVRYGHDDAITSAISRVVDLRVVWGGDATVAAIRALPLAPGARDLGFGDRFSFSAIASAPYLDADAALRRTLATRFFNDAMWFDQAGCSSPRLVVFCGEAPACAEACSRFFAEFDALLRERRHEVELGHALAKLTFSYRAALDGKLSAHQRPSNELSVLTLRSLEEFDRSHPGAGLFFAARAETLEQLGTFVARRDQTLGHYGFAADELRALVRKLNGRGLDRLVPLGEALTFNRYWDGYDLLQEFTRRVYLA